MATGRTSKSKTAVQSTVKRPRRTAGKGKASPSTAPTGKPMFFEIVNWRKAQPKMRGPNQAWCKAYTSLLDSDAYAGLDDAARVLLHNLWLLAARLGTHVFPADAAWLWRKMPHLHSKPDLQPLLEAKDVFGEPRPFVAHCEAAAGTATEARSDVTSDQPAAQNSQVKRGRRAQKREERREEKREKPLRVSEDNKKNRLERVSSRPSAHCGKHSKADQNRAQETTPQHSQGEQTTPQQREKSVNPKESEAGGAKVTPAAQATDQPPRRSVTNSQFRTTGKIPIWWTDPTCVAFSYAVFNELGLKLDPESQAGKAERGAFAAWLFQTRARVPVSDWPWLEEKAIAKAREIKRYGKAARSPGAVWLRVMAREIEARAGPPPGGVSEQVVC